MSLAEIVDVGALWQTVWTAAVAGVLVTVCCSVAVLGAARRGERPAWTAAAGLGTLGTLAVVAFGVHLVIS